MLNKKDFEKLRNEIHKADENRESVIQLSREIINVSKQVIYAAQRNEINEDLVKKIREKVKLLKKIDFCVDTNISSVAFQEYVEAMCFHGFVKSGKIPSSKDLEVSAEDYLAGICDLTGELVRKAIYDVIHKKYDEALKIKELVHDIYGEFLNLHLRNGELRKKSDSIKWNLKKLEEVMYDIEMKGRN